MQQGIKTLSRRELVKRLKEFKAQPYCVWPDGSIIETSREVIAKEMVLIEKELETFNR